MTPIDSRAETRPRSLVIGSVGNGGRSPCHGSAYEIHAWSAKRIQSRSAKPSQLRSAKPSQLRSAKRIHPAGVRDWQKMPRNPPSGSTPDRGPEPVLDEASEAQARSGRRRPGPGNERVEDRYASTARSWCDCTEWD